jgi:hypothetical protein
VRYLTGGAGAAFGGIDPLGRTAFAVWIGIGNDAAQRVRW